MSLSWGRVGLVPSNSIYYLYGCEVEFDCISSRSRALFQTGGHSASQTLMTLKMGMRCTVVYGKYKRRSFKYFEKWKNKKTKKSKLHSYIFYILYLAERSENKDNLPLVYILLFLYDIVQNEFNKSDSNSIHRLDGSVLCFVSCYR